MSREKLADRRQKVDIHFKNARVACIVDNATSEPIVRTWETWISSPIAQI